MIIKPSVKSLPMYIIHRQTTQSMTKKHYQISTSQVLVFHPEEYQVDSRVFPR